ncbi:SRPBCC family protein [Parafrankia discariae]|uniref:SRPBCC family protein n=1 Tax=Parafrankia discariae TaxID=365528 RepID=UPI0004763163|nr:SRPBCC family protein [Parafrankia discariae]
MWSCEHGVVTTASPDAVWRLWADVAGWGSWNADIKSIDVDGPFEVGTVIVMNPASDDPVRLRLSEVQPPERFVDEAELDDIVVRTTHLVGRIDAEHCRVSYRMEIDGPAADELGPRIGPAISGDFPETIAALTRLAEAAAAPARP